MKGTPYINYLLDKIKLYEATNGCRPEKVILSIWYFNKLREELTKINPSSTQTYSTIYGIPIVVKPRNKIPNWKHIYLGDINVWRQNNMQMWKNI